MLVTMQVCVLGAGSWGTTVASLASQNAPTTLWCRDPQLAQEINTFHENRRYLAGFGLHENLRATPDLKAAVSGADLIVVGVPSTYFRETLIQVARWVRPWVPIISLAKGLETGTGLRMTQVSKQVLPGHPAGALTGPNLAKEILAGSVAASVLAIADEVMGEALQGVFSNAIFRVYRNDDVIGAELGGALKNVIAIAMGVADGIGSSDNTRAALITRGLAEITRLGVALGGRPETFAGLAGMGDLLATCISDQSRNRHFGEQLATGKTVEQVAAEMDQVAEGVRSAPVIVGLARQVGVEAPLAEMVSAVVAGEVSAEDAYYAILGRHATKELRLK